MPDGRVSMNEHSSFVSERLPTVPFAIRKIEYPYDGEGVAEWPKDLLPAEKISTEKDALMEKLAVWMREQGPQSEEVYKLVFKVASYDLRDGLNLAQDVGLPAAKLREMVFQAQLVPCPSLIAALRGIDAFTDPLGALLAAAPRQKRHRTPEEELTLTESEKEIEALREVRDLSRVTRIDQRVVRENVLSADSVRQRIDAQPLSTEGEAYLEEIKTVYSSVAYHNPALRYKTLSLEERDPLEHLSPEEAGALEFVHRVKETHGYDRYMDRETLALGVIRGECGPEIAAAVEFPDGTPDQWEDGDRQRVLQRIDAFQKALGDYDNPLMAISNMVWVYVKRNRAYDEEDKNVYLSEISWRLASHKGISDWLRDKTVRDHPLRDLKSEARQHAAELRRIRKQFTRLAEEYATEGDTYQARQAEKRIEVLSKLIEVMTQEFQEERNQYSPNPDSIGLLDDIAYAENPYQGVDRFREFFYDGVGGRRPLLLGIGVSAHQSVFHPEEVKGLFEALFPETTAFIGGRGVLKGLEERNQHAYRQEQYRETSRAFAPKDRSLNYDGDPKARGSRLMEFPEPFSGNLVQGLYKRYDDRRQSWSQPETSAQADIKQPFKDTVMRLDVNNYGDDRRVRLPQTLQSQILLDQILVEVYRRPGEGTVQRALRPRVTAWGQLEVELPPHPPTVVAVSYVMRESLNPPQPENLTQLGYEEWLKKEFISSVDLKNEQEKASLCLPASIKAFVDGISALPPLERVVRIQEEVKKIGYYDRENGEVAYVKRHQRRVDRFETLRVRMEEVRRRRPNVSGEKAFAGVCVDFEEMCNAMLAYSGIYSGKIDSIRVNKATEATTQNVHACAYVVFPDAQGRRTMIEVDATPAIDGEDGSDEPSLAANLGAPPPLREVLKEVLSSQQEREIREVDIKMESDEGIPKEFRKPRRQDVKRVHGFPAREPLDDAELRARLEQLSATERQLAQEIASQLTHEDRACLLSLRDLLMYTDLKQTLSGAARIDLTHRVLILKMLGPATERRDPPREQPALVQAMALVRKWKEVQVDWSTYFGSPRAASEALRNCMEVMKTRVSPALSSAAKKLTALV